VIHPSWLLSVVVLSAFTYPTVARQLVPDAGMPLALIVAILAVVPIAACIVVHELAHALVARMHGLRVDRIVLFAFGGVSVIAGAAPLPTIEYAIAAAGPILSVVLASSLASLSLVLGSHAIADVIGVYALVNLALALFNLVPAFPMDGGRVLRSLLWWGTGDRARATRWSARVGKGLAGALVVLGLYLVLAPIGRVGRPDISGVWTSMVGLFIYGAAGDAERVEGGNDPR
jgi:Zn-dependent protease